MKIIFCCDSDIVLNSKPNAPKCSVAPGTQTNFGGCAEIKNKQMANFGQYFGGK